MEVLLKNLLIYFIESFSFYVIGCTIQNIKIHLTRNLLLSFVLFPLLFTLCEFWFSNPILLFILQTILYLFFSAWNLHIPILELPHIFLIIYSIEMFLQFVVFIPCQLLNLPVEQTYLQLTGIFCTLLFCIIVYFFLPLHKFYTFILHTSVLTQMLITNLFIILVTLVLYYRFQRTSSFTTSLLFIFIVLTSVGINTELLTNNLKLHKKQKELEAYERYLPIIEELIDQVRIRQHKFDNEIQAICALPLLHNNYNELVTAINQHSKLCFQENLPISFLKLNTKLLAGFFYQKMTTSQKKGITLNFDIKNFCLQTIVPEYELLELVGILLDNAIEATPEGNFIDIVLDSLDGKTIFSISNPNPPMSPQLQRIIFEKGYTTKSSHAEQHGFGLYILKQKTDNYKGKIELENTTRYGKSYFRICLKI